MPGGWKKAGQQQWSQGALFPVRWGTEEGVKENWLVGQWGVGQVKMLRWHPLCWGVSEGTVKVSSRFWEEHMTVLGVSELEQGDSGALATGVQTKTIK